MSRIPDANTPFPEHPYTAGDRLALLRTIIVARDRTKVVEFHEAAMIFLALRFQCAVDDIEAMDPRDYDTLVLRATSEANRYISSVATPKEWFDKLMASK